jgi:anti-sigma factor RsiW
MTNISDDILVAFVDGELDAAQSGAVERALVADEDLRRRADILRATAGWMRDAFPANAEAMAPAPAVALKAPRVRSWRSLPWAAPMAASLAAFAIGLGGGYVGAHSKLFPHAALVPAVNSEEVVDEIVEYYRTYWLDGRYLVERPASDRHAIDAWMTTRFRRQILTPNLDSHGLKFQGARVMALEAEGQGVLDGFRSQATMVLVYHTPENRVVSVIVSRARDIPNSDPTTSKRSGKNVVTWVHDGIRFTLVGGIDASLLQAAVPDLRRQFDENL